MAMDLSGLVPPPPIESLALCHALVEGASTSLVCSSGGPTGSFVRAGSYVFSISTMADDEAKAVSMALAGKVPLASDVDPTLDPGQLAAAEEFVTKLAADPGQVLVAELGLRAYAWIVSQTLAAVADAHFSGSIAAALASLEAHGFSAPAGWLSLVPPVYLSIHPDDSSQAKTSRIALAYAAAFWGLVTVEHHPGTAGLTVSPSSTAIGNELDVGDWEDRVRAGLSAAQIGSEAITWKSVYSGSGGGADMYSFGTYSSPDLDKLTAQGIGVVGDAIGASLLSLATALDQVGVQGGANVPFPSAGGNVFTPNFHDFHPVLFPGAGAGGGPAVVCPAGSTFDAASGKCLANVPPGVPLPGGAKDPVASCAAAGGVWNATTKACDKKAEQGKPSALRKALPWILGGAVVAAGGAALFFATRGSDSRLANPVRTPRRGVRKSNPARTLPALRPDGTLPAYTSVGSYPLVYLTKRDDVLCAKCATEALRADEEPPVLGDVHWEGEPLECAECGAAIESAYGPVSK